MKNKKRKSKGRSAPAAVPARRLIWPVFAAVFFVALDFFDIHSLEFLKRYRDAWGVGDYNVNFILAGAWAAGLLLLMLSPRLSGC